MAASTVAFYQAVLNTGSSVLTFYSGSTDGVTLGPIPDWSKAILLYRNYDTAAAVLTINAGTSGSIWINKGIGSYNCTAAATASSAYYCIVLESLRFSSTNREIYITSDSTASSLVKFALIGLPSSGIQ